ncbi:MAG: hypothetical protein EZS28_032925 [Streblomastix strix]|uniref:Uncharacterized protein n=1 Tax=Streblomastix strix TaxID=222440 RepID=A0A5J4UM15_9EUKA|nr:MAG: hypothetical protein EZS28_032925 [Streblomastix strix]
MKFIIIALIAISFSQLDQFSRLYYKYGEINKKGILTLNATYAKDPSYIEDVYESVIDYKLLQKKTKADDQYFYTKWENIEDIQNSETSYPLTELETNCKNVALIHQSGLYGLVGFTLQALTKAQYAPSISYWIKNCPNKVKYDNIEDKFKEQFKDKIIEQTCEYEEILDYLSFGLHKGGVSSSKCISNSIIPDYIQYCEDNSKISTELKGYRIGYIRQCNSDTIKELILRFGAILIDEMVIVGWKQINNESYWIDAIKDDQEYKYTGAIVPMDIVKKCHGGYVLFKFPSRFNMIGLILGIIFGVLFGSVIIMAIIEFMICVCCFDNMNCCECCECCSCCECACCQCKCNGPQIFPQILPANGIIRDLSVAGECAKSMQD